MRWSQDGSPVPTTLFEAAALHFSLRVMCRCGRTASFDPHGLWWYFHRRDWHDKLSAARERFYCRHCRQAGNVVRPARIDPVPGSDRDVCLPPPPDDEWKRALRTFR